MAQYWNYAKGKIERDGKGYATNRMPLWVKPNRNCLLYTSVEVNKQFLSQSEINRIWQKEFKIERLELVRDVFIFCVYTGLAFIDVYNLHPEHISEAVSYTHLIFCIYRCNFFIIDFFHLVG